MKIITSKIPGERPRQYAAWLLYTEAGSLEKTLQIWERISAQDDTKLIPLFGTFLGKPVGLATLKRWSTKYGWKERTELKTTEDLEGMRRQFKWIQQTRAYRIAILFDLIMKKYTRQLEQGMHVTARDLYMVWKMHRVEEGLPTEYYQVSTYEEPPIETKTPEEIELDKKILRVAERLSKNKNKEEQPTIT
jgi:hypothetical protein